MFIKMQAMIFSVGKGQMFGEVDKIIPTIGLPG